MTRTIPLRQRKPAITTARQKRQASAKSRAAAAASKSPLLALSFVRAGRGGSGIANHWAPRRPADDIAATKAGQNHLRELVGWLRHNPALRRGSLMTVMADMIEGGACASAERGFLEQLERYFLIGIGLPLPRDEIDSGRASSDPGSLPKRPIPAAGSHAGETDMKKSFDHHVFERDVRAGTILFLSPDEIDWAAHGDPILALAAEYRRLRGLFSDATEKELPLLEHAYYEVEDVMVKTRADTLAGTIEKLRLLVERAGDHSLIKPDDAFLHSALADLEAMAIAQRVVERRVDLDANADAELIHLHREWASISTEMWSLQAELDAREDHLRQEQQLDDEAIRRDAEFMRIGALRDREEEELVRIEKKIAAIDRVNSVAGIAVLLDLACEVDIDVTLDALTEIAPRIGTLIKAVMRLAPEIEFASLGQAMAPEQRAFFLNGPEAAPAVAQEVDAIGEAYRAIDLLVSLGVVNENHAEQMRAGASIKIRERALIDGAAPGRPTDDAAIIQASARWLEMRDELFIDGVVHGDESRVFAWDAIIEKQLIPATPRTAAGAYAQLRALLISVTDFACADAKENDWPAPAAEAAKKAIDRLGQLARLGIAPAAKPRNQAPAMATAAE